MASKLCVLLTLALISYNGASPVPDATAVTTTVADEEPIPVYAVVELVEEVPEVVTFIEATTTEPAEVTHKVSRRSLRGDNPIDLLTDFEGANYDNYYLESLAGRRIKTLPSWVG